MIFFGYLEVVSYVNSFYKLLQVSAKFAHQIIAVVKLGGL